MDKKENKIENFFKNEKSRTIFITIIITIIILIIVIVVIIYTLPDIKNGNRSHSSNNNKNEFPLTNGETYKIIPLQNTEKILNATKTKLVNSVSYGNSYNKTTNS